MRIMTIHAILAFELAGFAAPIAAGPPMSAAFPIAKCWPMATSTQFRAVGAFQFTSVARLETVKIVFVMAIIAVVVSVVISVFHDNFLMLLGQHRVLPRIVMKRNVFSIFMAGIAIEAGKVAFISGGRGIGFANRIC